MSRKKLLEDSAKAVKSNTEELDRTRSIIARMTGTTLSRQEVQTPVYTDSVMSRHLDTSQIAVSRNLDTPQTVVYVPPQPLSRPKNNPLSRLKRNPNETQVNFYIEREFLIEIKQLCLKTGFTLKEFFEAASRQQFEILSRQNLMSRHLDHDDMMIFTTHDDIIMRYQEYTLQKWNRRNDREGQRYNQVDRCLLDIAFISTIEKKLRGNTAKQPIKSFNYFTQEIDLLIEQQRCGELPAALDEYHKYVLSTWEKRIRKIRDEKWANKKTG